MSDELPGEDPGAVDTPNPVDFEKRYRDTHANWNSLNEQMTRFKQDPSALIEFIQETHPDLLVSDEDEEEDPDFSVVDDDDPVAPLNSRLDKFEQWQQQVENERGQTRFKNDLKAELGDETLPKKANDWIQSRTAALGNNPKALKQAVEEYREIVGEIRGPVRKASTPTPPQPGKAGEQDYNASKDPNARRTARRARIAAQVEAGMQEQ